jgi:hypothetical protein
MLFSNEVIHTKQKGSVILQNPFLFIYISTKSQLGNYLFEILFNEI